jgi:hypothetical protein
LHTVLLVRVSANVSDPAAGGQRHGTVSPLPRGEKGECLDPSTPSHLAINIHITEIFHTIFIFDVLIASNTIAIYFSLFLFFFFFERAEDIF